MSQNLPFVVKPELTQIAIAYRNRAFIADEVLPRIPVGAREFEYLIYNKNERFTIPDTTVGRKGRPNQVEFGATTTTGAVKDYGLDDPIPNEDIEAAQKIPGYDPKGNAVEGIQELIDLDREKRVADLVFNVNTYPVANRLTLSGTDQWSDLANSDPIDDLIQMLRIPLMRPNTVVLGDAVWAVLQKHPKMATALYGSGTSGKLINPEELARVLRVQKVLIGEAVYNTANEGQTASFSTLWGKHVALLHLNRLANTKKGVTFGYTAQWGPRVAGEIVDPHIGLTGGVIVRNGERVGETIVASDVGCIIQNAVA